MVQDRPRQGGQGDPQHGGRPAQTDGGGDRGGGEQKAAGRLFQGVGEAGQRADEQETANSE